MKESETGGEQDHEKRTSTGEEEKGKG